MENKIKNIPKVRFVGFEEEWVVVNLGEITECYSGGTPSVGVALYYGGNIPFIRSGEINSYSTKLFITENGLNDSSAKLVRKGDILYALYGATSGEVGISNINGAINQAVLAIKTKNKYDTKYLAHWLRKQKKSIVKTYIQGGQGNLSGNIVKSLEINIPSPPEQKKIGNYFQTIDQLIEQQQQKHDKLRILKKAMLAKMFPKEGATTPEIRFKGFTEEWVEKSLGKIYNFQYGVFNTNPNNGGKYPIYGANGIIGGYTDFNAKDSIVIGHMGEYAGIVLWADGEHFVTYNGIITKPKTDEILPKFGYFLLHRMNLRKICGGSGQPFLSYDTLNKLNGVFPKSHTEQKQIASYFKNLDHLINQHKEKIAKLKQLKKACLHQMFV